MEKRKLLFRINSTQKDSPKEVYGIVDNYRDLFLDIEFNEHDRLHYLLVTWKKDNQHRIYLKRQVYSETGRETMRSQVGYIDYISKKFYPQKQDYLLKPQVGEVLLRTIELMYDGQHWLYPQVAPMPLTLKTEIQVKLQTKEVKIDNKEHIIKAESFSIAPTKATPVSVVEQPQILCKSCFNRFECFHSYSKRTSCDEYEPGPSTVPSHWPNWMQGPY